MRVNEPVAVITDATSGAPLAFTWRTVRYLAVSEPERWFTKQKWWRLASPTPTTPQQGKPVFVPESLVWRVDALRRPSLENESFDEASFDLAYHHRHGWVLLSVSGGRYDEQLFA